MTTQGVRTKKIRQALGLSQEGFGDKIGLSRAGIAAVEGDKNKFSQDTLYNLAVLLNVNLNFLVSGKGTMFIESCENTHSFIKNETPVQNLSQWGERLSQLLADNKETPYAFSKRTGISERRIEKFILDSAEPTLQELTAIKCNVDICTDELLYGQTVEKNTTADVSLSRDEILKLKKLLSD